MRSRLAVYLLALLLAAPAAQNIPIAGETATGPQRVVSLAPNLTEMLFYLGYGSQIVGRTDFCNFPPEAEEIDTIGGFVDTSLEKIVSLNPDLVLAYQGNSLELVDQLETLDIEVLALHEAQTLAEVASQMTALDAALNGGDGSAAELIQSWKQRLANLRRETTAEDCPALLFGYPGEETLTCGSQTFLDDLILLAGARNIASKAGSGWLSISAEFILASDPEWILTASDCSGEESLQDARRRLLEEMRGDAVWSELSAVCNGNVVVIESDVLLRPGPRILDALEQLQESIAGMPGGKAQ